MYLAKIYVTYKPSILDPQGESVKAALKNLNYQGVEDVTVGKYFEVKLQAESKAAAEKEVKAMSDQLLVNVNMETYRFELQALEAV